jgi:hypothetical protein
VATRTLHDTRGPYRQSLIRRRRSNADDEVEKYREDSSCQARRGRPALGLGKLPSKLVNRAAHGVDLGGQRKLPAPRASNLALMAPPAP